MVICELIKMKLVGWMKKLKRDVNFNVNNSNFEELLTSLKKYLEFSYNYNKYLSYNDY
jgi:hypothetical protein